MPPAGPAPTVAVVGAGLAGLTAAWRLVQRGFGVTLFERHGAPGFVAHSVQVPTDLVTPGDSAAALPPRVDVPIRVFYAGYYPTLVRLYAELGVATEAVSYASSFHRDDGTLYFRYRNWLVGERSYSWVAPHDLAGAPARRIAAAALRFGWRAPRALAAGALAGISIGEHVQREGYGDDFVQGLLLPAVATICTCSHDDAWRIPAAVVVDYLARGLAREPVRRARQGADEVARRLIEGIRAGGGRIELARTLLSLRHTEAAAGEAPLALRFADGRVERFEHVVLATQANQAIALLDDAAVAERALLKAFRYRPVDVVMHRDAALLPPRRRDWSAVNLLVVPGQAQPQSTIWVNAVMPVLQPRGGRPRASDAPLFQTVHPLREPRPGLRISQARFERPVVDAASERALPVLARLHAEAGRRLWFCGSYAQPGVPLLESAVRAAEVVVTALARAAAAAARADTSYGASGNAAARPLNTA
jgi:predicted NAD/FAD-binding protein